MELKCLKCGGKIVEDDCIETTRMETKIIAEKVGHCVECGTDHLWTDFYDYIATENFLMEGD
jgi:hypothetical protein